MIKSRHHKKEIITNKMDFKLYEEDELLWPVHSFIIKNSHQILPKNGESRRVFEEQDYASDRDTVNNAK